MRVKNLKKSLINEFIETDKQKNTNLKPISEPQYKLEADKLYVITLARNLENWDIMPNMLYEFSNDESGRKIFVLRLDSDGNTTDITKKFNDFLIQKKSQKSQTETQIEK